MLHNLHVHAKKKKWKTVCFEGYMYSKAVMFHTHELYDPCLACQLTLFQT